MKIISLSGKGFRFENWSGLDGVLVSCVIKIKDCFVVFVTTFCFVSGDVKPDMQFSKVDQAPLAIAIFLCKKRMIGPESSPNSDASLVFDTS